MKDLSKTDEAIHRIAPEFELIDIDETTYFEDRFLEKHKIAKIHGRYMYDKKSVTYICSANPMYAMHYVDFAITLEEGADPDVLEEAYDELEWEYCHQDLVSYMSRYRIDNLPQDDRERIMLEETQAYADLQDGEYEQLVEDTLSEARAG